MYENPVVWVRARQSFITLIVPTIICESSINRSNLYKFPANKKLPFKSIIHRSLTSNLVRLGLNVPVKYNFDRTAIRARWRRRVRRLRKILNVPTALEYTDALMLNFDIKCVLNVIILCCNTLLLKMRRQNKFLLLKISVLSKVVLRYVHFNIHKQILLHFFTTF